MWVLVDQVEQFGVGEVFEQITFLSLDETLHTSDGWLTQQGAVKHNESRRLDNAWTTAVPRRNGLVFCRELARESLERRPTLPKGASIRLENDSLGVDLDGEHR